MVDQLGEEETEGLAVRDAAVGREVHLSCTAQCSDEVDRDQSRLGGHLVGLELRHPTALAMISKLDHGLVDVNDSKSLGERFDEARRSELALQQSRARILD